MPSWYASGDNLYNSSEAYADENENYFRTARSEGFYNSSGLSWSSNSDMRASPVTSISTASGIEVPFGHEKGPASTCVSPTTISFAEPDVYAAADWMAVNGNDWQRTSFEYTGYDLEFAVSSLSSHPASPPPKKQKCDPSVHDSEKSTLAMTLQPPPPPPPTPRATCSSIKTECVFAGANYGVETPPSPPTPPQIASERPQQLHSIQLRTASRQPKRTTAHKPTVSEGERLARETHNRVEKQYRNRLNAQFERLLAVLSLPSSDDDGGSDNRRLSKAEVLDIARRTIKSLERERDNFSMQVKELSAIVSRLKEEIIQHRRG